MKSVNIAIYGSQDDFFELCILLRITYKYDLNVHYYSEKSNIENIFKNKYDVVLMNDYIKLIHLFTTINDKLLFSSNEYIVYNKFNNTKLIGFPDLKLFDIVSNQSSERLSFINKVLSDES